MPPTTPSPHDPPQEFQEFRCLDGKGPPLKAHPSNHDRNWMSPNIDDGPTAHNEFGSFTYYDATHPIQIDTTSLNRFQLGNVELSLILVRRVDHKPFYRYLGHGLSKASSYSMSKFIAATAAAARMREATQGKLGLDGFVVTHTGNIPIGDLITAFCYYDESHVKSNGVANWFRTVSTRARGHQLVRDVGTQLGFADDDFAWHFTAEAPPFGGDFRAADGSAHHLELDSAAPLHSNMLHTMTSAEILKRLVMFRENPETRFDHVLWEDIQVLLYGAPASLWYPDPNRLHGMCADTATYIQQAFYELPIGNDQFPTVAERANGEWRIFSKMGFDTGHFVHTGYACFPVYQAGAIRPGWGKEFFISGRVNAQDGDEILAEAYRKVIVDIENGRLA
ncbi:MAG: hypothetical protein U0931_41475 [Vulcanimicrobiota bacterium]